MEAEKKDQDKPRMDLIPLGPLVGAGKVFTFGAKKYSDRNWEKGLKYGRLFGALLRHLFTWWMGEECDPESGHSHLDHAMCCLLMLHDTHYNISKQVRDFLDDRPAATNQI